MPSRLSSTSIASKERNSARQTNRGFADVEKTAGSLGDRLVPCVQRHEFEGLLFFEVEAFSVIADIPPQALRTLVKIRSDFTTPET